jgi:hypothetical protein
MLQGVVTDPADPFIEFWRHHSAPIQGEESGVRR